MNKSWRLFGAGWLTILVGILLAHFVQTSGGIRLKDVRFAGPSGETMSALLYIPKSATATNKAPGIVAVHGYINTREVQSAFAIEYARRGYVVLALDQTGHGHSDPPAFANGFGGPAALMYLRSLDMVDVENIGLEGHSMGGWTVLAAAITFPDAYKAMVLLGSSTGAPFAAEGTPDWPRNMALVFSKYDEFATTMWGVERASDVGASQKLRVLFGAQSEVVEGQLYGDIANGTARILYQPPVTHPGDHISRRAIGHSIDWFAQTLSGGTPIASDNQIWMYKELGTTIALVGFVVLVLGTFQLLLSMGYFSQLNAMPSQFAYERRSAKWCMVAMASAIIPVATFYLFFKWGEKLLPASALLPQQITNQVIFWAVLNGLIVTIVGFLIRSAPVQGGKKILPSLLIAVGTIAIAYAAVATVNILFHLDFRFWFVGVKTLSLIQAKSALVYLLPFMLYFILALRALHQGLSVAGVGRFAQYSANAMVMMGGFLLFLILQYGALFSGGVLLTPSEPLNTIVMLQFVPLLLIVSIISTFAYRRTANYLPGAFINGLFVTWYIVAGQATQFAVT